jgi:hypothetical protein
MADEILTQEDAQKAFNAIAQAVHSSDATKLSELMDEKPSEEKAPVEETIPAEETKPEEIDNKDTTTAPPEETKAETVEQIEETKPVEKTELELVKEKLEALAKENHALRSQAGRVPHVQRKLKELDKKLDELTKSPPSSQASAKIEPKITELLKGVKDTDPELADTIAAVVAEAIKGVSEDMHAKERETLSLFRQSEFETYQEAEVKRLLDMYPNAPEVIQSPTWTEWKKEQTPRIVSLAQSDNADDVAFAFEKYAKDMVAKYPDAFKQQEVKAEPTAPSPNAGGRAAQIEAERARKKTTAANVSTPVAPGKVEMPDDPEALFKMLSEKIRKERTG